MFLIPISPIKVVLLGSLRLLLQHGLRELLAGRFELIRMGHWSFSEMQDAFGITTDQFVFFGGYPGAVPLLCGLQKYARNEARKYNSISSIPTVPRSPRAACAETYPQVVRE